MAIFLVLLLGFFLRLISLNQSLWLDEATSIIVSRDFSFSEILTRFSPGDFHPPLYYLLLKIWISAFGSGEVIARLISIIFAVGTIPLVFSIGERLFNKNVGLVSALFLATAPLHIYYSQEVRMYAMATFLATLVAYFAVKVFTEKKADRKNFIFLTLASGALLYTDYLPAFLIASFFIFLVIYKREYFRLFFVWFLGTALLVAPWLPTFSAQLERGLEVRQNAPIWWATLGKTNLKELALVPVKFIIGRISSYNKVFYALSVIFASLPFMVLLFSSVLAISKSRFLWFWFLGPLVLAAVFGSVFSGFSYFRLIFVIPAFYLLIAYGAYSVSRKEIRKLLIIGIILVNLTSSGIYLLNPRFHREDWRSAVRFIEENSQNSAVVFVRKSQRDPYHYYAKSVPSFGPEGIELGFPQVWLVRYVQPIFDPKDEVRRKLEERGYQKIREVDFNGIVVWEYER